MTKAEIVAGLRHFICTELLTRPAYPLGDDEPLLTSGLIDSFALAHVAVYVETAFGIYVPDVELTAEDVDTIDRIATLILAVGRRTDGS